MDSELKIIKERNDRFIQSMKDSQGMYFNEGYLKNDLGIEPLEDEFKLDQIGYPNNNLNITNHRLIEQDPFKQEVLYTVNLEDINYAHIDNNLYTLVIRTTSGETRKLRLPGKPGYDGTEATAFNNSAYKFVSLISLALKNSASSINEVDIESNSKSLGKFVFIYFGVFAAIYVFFKVLHN